MERSKHGGKREGAGRKPSGLPKTKSINFRVAPQTYEAMIAEAARRKTTITQMIEDIFLSTPETEAK